MKRIGFGVAVAIAVGTLVGMAVGYAVWQVESLRAVLTSAVPKGTVPFSSNENWDSPPLIPSPVLSAPGRAIGVQEEPAPADEATCAAQPAAGDASEQSELGPTPTLAPGIPPDLRSHGELIYIEVEAAGDGLQVGVEDGER